MLSKLASLISLIAFASSAPQHSQPASQFPAGVDPALCPNFPICDNALLHNPQPSSQPGQWSPPVQPAPQQGQWSNHPPTPAQPGQWGSPTATPQNQWNNQLTGFPQSHWNTQPAAGPGTNQWIQPQPSQYNSPTPQWQSSTASGQWGAASTPAPYYPTAPAQNWALSTPAPYFQPQQESYNPATNEVDSTGGDKYPAGVNPQTCPNYPYCDSPILGAGAGGSAPTAPQPAPLPGFPDRLYPAGVSPQQCPNFPYC